MEVIGSCVVPMVFSPVDRLFRISFRIVRNLPYAVVLGATFMKEYQSTISFLEKGGFGPTPESTWVPLSSQLGDVIQGRHCRLDRILCCSTNRRQ